jgi:hypothetical protein
MASPIFSRITKGNKTWSEQDGGHPLAKQWRDASHAQSHNSRNSERDYANSDHLQDHIETIAKHEQEFQSGRSRGERIGGRIAAFAGSFPSCESAL